MTKPIPTVEQLVEVFRANNWKPTTGNQGIMGVQDGNCCAIPAALALHHKLEEILELKLYEMYQLLSEDYGKSSDYLWRGFDQVYSIEDAKGWCEKEEFEWFNLGYTLRESL